MARQAAAREARAIWLDDILVVGPMPFAAGTVETEPARSAELLAIVKLPLAQAEAFVPRLIAIVAHDTPADDESAALLRAARRSAPAGRAGCPRTS